MIIEELLYDFLAKNLNANVYIEKPPQPKYPYVLLDRTGGGEVNKGIYQCNIAIQSFDKSLYMTMHLNRDVKKAMERFNDLSQICKCSLNSDYNFTKANTKEYRYQAYYNIVYYD